MYAIKSDSPHAISLFERGIPDEVLVITFEELLKQLPDLRPQHTLSYRLVSKKFKRLLMQAKDRAFIYWLSKIPEAAAQIQGQANLQNKKQALSTWTMQKNPEKHGDCILHQIVKEILEEKRPFCDLEFFLNSGANVNTENNHGVTPLVRAANFVTEENQPKKELIIKIISLLLEHGANPNGSETKSTLLSVLSYIPTNVKYKAFQLEVLGILCNAGADSQRKFKTSLTVRPLSPLDRAKEHYEEALSSLRIPR